jgi:hypothetical protein
MAATFARTRHEIHRQEADIREDIGVTQVGIELDAVEGRDAIG